MSELSSCIHSIVVNGDFESNISAWSAVEGIGTARWDNLDADGSGNSGSILLVNNSPPEAQNTSVSQCQAIAPSAIYDLTAKIHPDNFCCVIASPSGTRRALHTGFLYVLVNYYSKASCGGTPRNEFVRLDSDSRNEWQSLAQTFFTPAAAVSARITLAIFKTERGDNLTGHFDNVLLVPSGSGQSDPTELCLGQGRFKAQAQWTTPDGQTGAAQAVSLTSDTGYFWFFNRANVEMIVKVLNGCGFNSNYWVFAGGLTNVQVVLTVTDTQTGSLRTYRSGQGTAFVPIQDTSAFSACSLSGPAGLDRAPPALSPSSRAPSLLPGGGASPAAPVDSPKPLAEKSAGACVADAQTLCLNDARFAVTTLWSTPDGQSGTGVPVSLTSDTGYFWFFSAANVEMVVKVLDGCGVNSNFWLFAGGLTNVHVVMTVTDTQTGLTRTYANPQGTAFVPIQDTGNFPVCP